MASHSALPTQRPRRSAALLAAAGSALALAACTGGPQGTGGPEEPDTPSSAAPSDVAWTQRAVEVCGTPIDEVYRPTGDTSAVDHVAVTLLDGSTSAQLEIEVELGGPGYDSIDLFASDVFVVLVDPASGSVSAVMAAEGEAVTFTELADPIEIGAPAESTTTAVPVPCGDHAPTDQVGVEPLPDGDYELVVEGDLFSPGAAFEQPISWAAEPFPIEVAGGAVTAG
ncbi:hypothetical protein ACPYO6_08280 [Georgenia sp. Z1344]|uniref:hypothetical protein n=1 Tax=Georgenia sp. Z1344 TaxID=3416706 RepID=UPI003CFB050E